MAVSTKIIGSLARPRKVPSPFSMDTCLPVIILRAMTFAAESVALCEIYEVTIIKPQFIAVSCIVAVETPSHGFGMMKLDIRVLFFQDSLRSIHFHGRVAVAAGEHSFGHRRRRIFFDDGHSGRSEKKQQKQ